MAGLLILLWIYLILYHQVDRILACFKKKKIEKDDKEIAVTLKSHNPNYAIMSFEKSLWEALTWFPPSRPHRL